AQARAVPTAGALSIGGLLKHVATTESFWLDVVLQQHEPFSWEAADGYMDEFAMSDEESLDAILARYDKVAARTESIVRGLPMDHPVPVPEAPWFPTDVEAWTLRWVLLHLIQETGRHAGHADIVRESIDGATAFELLAAAEDWPDEPWLQKWQPASVAA
ncbi:MAG TPA: DinB family protein, partial [Acidimicrobiales bacterium]|nr:DinB family protein [Acidimicrobiales bacterium]